MIEQGDYDQLSALYNQALALEKKGEIEKAAPLYQQCLALDPADHCGASIRLASMGAAPPPLKAPDAYVETLFDQHADSFDAILTGDLEYAVPLQLADILVHSGEHHFDRMLDLGCGTGLSGMTLQTICDHATGVDISPKMIDQSDERQVYDALFINEAVHFLQEWKRAEGPDYLRFDLIVATDVLPYIGALEELFAHITDNLVAGGCFAFSCETMNEMVNDKDFAEDEFDPKGWTITPNQRFAHGDQYLKRLLHQNRFSTITHFDPITVRMEQGKPIAGWLVLAYQNKNQ